VQQAPIRAAVVGYGFIGRRHAQLLEAHPEVELVAICDNQTALAEEAPEGLAFYTDLEALLFGPNRPDVLHICTPNYLHIPQALAAVSAGCHVVVEKPMGLRAVDCEELLTAASNRDRKVFVVMQNRYTPAAQWLRTLITENRLGRILYAQVSCFWNRDDRYYLPSSWRGKRAQDGGVLYTQFSHFVDTLYWLLGPLTDFRAVMQNLHHRQTTEIEDTGSVQFRFLGGGIGTFQFTTAVWDRNMESSLTLVGERGSLRVGGQYMNAVEYCHIQGYEMPTLPPALPPNEYGLYQGSASNHSYVIQNVVDTLRGRATPATDGTDGLAVVQLLEAMYKAAGIVI
jgi:UDP-N-acetyl-2-amino-2-deoxyglucuronate dehydrogenase